MAEGARAGQITPSGPSRPPRTFPPAAGSPTALSAPVRYPPHFVQSALADASGVVTIAMDPVPTGEVWEVELVRVVSDSSGASTAKAYLDAVSLDGLLDQTTSGNFDVLEGTPPWRLLGGSRLAVQWTGLDASTAHAHLRVQYRVLGGTP